MPLRRPDFRPSIPVVEIRTAQVVQRMAPQGMWLFAAAMAASLALAVCGGLVLGVMAATRSGIARARWVETVQAHGDIQLWGWTAVFVVALVFEFIVRLNGRPPFPVAPRLAVLLLLAAGALVSASGRVLGHFEQPLAVGGSTLIVAGSAAFAFLIMRVPAIRPLKVDLHPLFFRAGAAWLVLAALAGLIASIRMQSGVTSLEESRVVVECFLRGFVANIIVAVALRAFPGHLGLPEVGAPSQRALWALINGSLLLWAAGTAGFGLAGVEALQRGGDLIFAAAMLWATVAFKIGRAVRHWGRASERYQVMVPVAWVGLVAYAAALAAQAIAGWGSGYSPALLEAGAVRHIFMLGFMAPLLIAMAHVVLERFGTGRVFWRNWLTAAFASLIVAWPLRVLPPFVDPGVGVTARGVMGAAGVLAAIGLAVAAGVAARNAIAIFGHERQFTRRSDSRSTGPST